MTENAGRGTLERAIEIAAATHAGQKDKGGAPYILHPLRVMLRVAPGAQQIVAVLHDVVEDSDGKVTFDDLASEGFSQEVIDGVTGLAVSYLRNGANAYTATPAQLSDVIALRVNLTLRGQKTLGGDVKIDGNNYITRTTSNVVSIRSRP